ncbi:MAG: BBP7 family outer membrane beta-barrel protein [Planctomycetota bacterium]|nr:BBP7 family outer membrane beta-barrel protein [Planctomycetota bacterium]
MDTLHQRLRGSKWLLWVGLALLLPALPVAAEDMPPDLFPPAAPQMADDAPVDTPPAPELPPAVPPADDGEPGEASPPHESSPVVPPPPMEAVPAPMEVIQPEDVTPCEPIVMRRRCNPCNRWDFTLEGALSLFDDPEGILGEPLPAGTTPFDWGLNELDEAFGGRVTVGYSVGRRYRVEGRFTWLGEWEGSSRQTAQFGTRPTPTAAVAVSPALTSTLTSETEMWGGELNVWRTIRADRCSQWDVGLGARYLRIDDTARATNWTGFPTADLLSEAENGFFCGQICGAYRRNMSSRFQVSFVGKVLLGGMSRDLSESDTRIVTGGPTANAVLEESDFAVGLEGEIGALWRISSRFGVTASYSILYVTEVARANEILDFSQGATGSVQLQDRTDSVVVHSFFFGFRVDL